MQQELKLRIVSGLILAAIVLAATWYGALAFRVLAVVIGLLIYYEWSKMTGIARDWVANAVGWIGEAAIAFLVLVGNFEFAVGMLAGVTAVGIALIILQGTSRWLPVGLFYAGATGLALAAIRGDDRLGLYAMIRRRCWMVLLSRLREKTAASGFPAISRTKQGPRCGRPQRAVTQTAFPASRRPGAYQGLAMVGW